MKLRDGSKAKRGQVVNLFGTAHCGRITAFKPSDEDLYVRWPPGTPSTISDGWFANFTLTPCVDKSDNAGDES